MIARGAIHNPKIFEEYKNSIDKLDLEEENQLKIKEDQFDIDNDYEEIKDGKKNEILIPENDNKQKSIDENNKNISMKKNKKNKNEENDEDDSNDVKSSNNLARIFELKYSGRKFDIVPTFCNSWLTDGSGCIC